MTNEEQAYYKRLYELVNDPKFELVVKYAQSKHEKQLRTHRIQCDQYGFGWNNGYLDAMEHIINLKSSLTKIMQNIRA